MGPVSEFCPMLKLSACEGALLSAEVKAELGRDGSECLIGRCEPNSSLVYVVFHFRGPP